MSGPAPTVDGEADGPTAWRVALASLLLITCGMGIEYLLWSNVKTISDDMGWSRGATSAAYALEMIGTGVGGILMGRWADRVGVAPVVLIGAVAIPSGAIAVSYVTQAWQFCLIFGVMIGLLGNATLFAPLITAATRWFVRRRGLAVAVVASGQGAAGVIWPPVFDGLIALHGWRGAVFVYGVFAMIAMPPLVLLLRGAPPGWSAMRAERKNRSGEPFRFGSPAENLPFVLLNGAILCCCVAMAMPLVHIASHVRDIGYASSDGAFLLAWIMGASFIGRLGMGFLADRIGGLGAMLIGSGMQASGLLAMVPSDSFAVLLVAAAAFGLGFGGLVPMYAVVLRSIHPARGLGWRIGAIFLSGAVGMAAGGQLAGLVFDWTGAYRWAFLLGFAANVVNLATIAAAAAIARTPRPRAAPASRRPG